MNPILWLLIVPMVAALISYRLPSRIMLPIFILLMMLQGAGLWLLANALSHANSSIPLSDPVTFSAGQWMAPLGLHFVADGLAWLMAATTTVIGLLSGIYAILYLRGANQHDQDRTPHGFWPLFWLLQTALNGIWFAADLFNAYVALEALTLIAVSMVVLQGSEKSLAAGLRYLYTGLLSSLCVLLGVALLYSAYGTLELANLRDLLQNDWVTQTALLFITLGLIIKTAIVPFHRWLPQAHGVALAPISALHSALVVKSSFYILARLWLETGSGLMHVSLAQLLGALGALSIFYAGYKALQQRDIKMLVAYSTVAQLGYLLLLFPLAYASIGTNAAVLAWQGSMLHVIAHAFAKAAMFLSISTLILALGSKRISALAGISTHIPLSLFAFGLASISLMGLPPSGGFNGKWLMLQSALSTGQWHWALVLIAGSLLTAMYIFKVFSVSFDQRAIDAGRGTVARAPWALEVIALILASIAILLGFAAAFPVELLTSEALL